MIEMAQLKFAAILLCSATGLFAYETYPGNETKDLFDMDLDDLAKVEVTSASQSKHKLNEAPGVITVITAEDLQRLGARTLSDALKITPGIQILDERSGLDSVWIRGITTGRNTKVLLLIDGVPQDEVIFGEWAPDEEIPLNSIERIEVLRGPGSALYGGNAYSGVISITTKSQVPQGTQISVGLGQYDSRRFDFNSGASWQGTRLISTGSAYKTTGYSVGHDRQGLSSTHNNNVSDYSLNGKLIHGDWQALLSVSDYTAEYPYYSSPQYKAQEYITTNISTIYSHELDNAQFDNQLYVHSVKRRYDRKIENPDGSLNFASYSDLDSVLSGLRTQYRYNFTPSQQLSSGLSLQSRVVNNFEEVDFIKNNQPVHSYESIIDRNGDRTPSSENYAAWLQQESSFAHDEVLLTAGLRYDHYPQFDGHVSPRLAVTWHPDGAWSSKLLWGKAFRPPTLEEQYEVRNDGNIAGNPNLTPELIETTEAELDYHFSTQANMALRAFRSKMTDFIVQSGLAPFSNLGNETIPGYEWEWTSQHYPAFLPQTRLTLSLNYTRLNTDVASVAPNNMNILLFADSSDFGFYLGANYVGRRNASDTYHNSVLDPSLKAQDNKDPYVAVDGSFSVRNIASSAWQMRLLIHNLLNHTYYNPTSEPDSYYDVKKESRNIELQMGYTF